MDNVGSEKTAQPPHHSERVEEKASISDNAKVGISLWQGGTDFIRSATQMMGKDIRTNGEPSASSAFNRLIARGGRVVAEEVEEMYGLVTQEDVDVFLASPNRDGLLS